MEYHDYSEDIKYGNVGEDVFINYLNKHNFIYQDVRKIKDYMEVDVDFIINNKWCDVKRSYKDDDIVIFEIYFNSNPKFGIHLPGWFYTSQSDVLIFLNSGGTTMIELENNFQLHNWYEKNQNKYHLERNKPTYNKQKDKWWEGRYVRIPLEDIPSNLYKKISLGIEKY